MGSTIVDRSVKSIVNYQPPLWRFRPHVEGLLHHRDTVISAWQQAHPGEDVFEDQDLELTGYLPISIEGWIKELSRERVQALI